MRPHASTRTSRLGAVFSHAGLLACLHAQLVTSELIALGSGMVEEDRAGALALNSDVFSEAELWPVGESSIVCPAQAHAGLQHGHHLHHGRRHRCPGGLLGWEPGREEVGTLPLCVCIVCTCVHVCN